jgi:glycosyltransferase involved in cell wall biosynthesis
LPINIARTIKRLALQPDVVECPEWCAEGLALGLRGSFPLVVRMHSGARQLFPYNGQGQRWKGLDGRAAIALEERSVRRANVVTATRSVLDEVADRLRLDSEATREIIYPMRPVEPVAAPSSGHPRVTFLGRFEPRKGPDVVLRAVPLVVAAVPDARFAFVGRDATSSEGVASAQWLRSQAERLRVAEAVEVREAFGGAVVDEELRRTTVSVVPSRWESFGYTAAEAMARSRPVIVSPIAAFRELVIDGETGLVASLDDPEAWAAALIKLLTQPNLAETLGRAGAGHVAAVSEPSRVAGLTADAHLLAIERWRRGERAGRRR